jgi:Skp1 family, dimerisation domain.
MITSQEKFNSQDKVNRFSGLIRTLLETDPEEKEYTLSSNVFKNETLASLFFEFMVKCNGVLPAIPSCPLSSSDLKDIVPKTHGWMVEYLDNIPKKTLFDLINVANYMDSPALLLYLCVKTATMIRGKKVEEIKSILKPDDE